MICIVIGHDFFNYDGFRNLVKSTKKTIYYRKVDDSKQYDLSFWIDLAKKYGNKMEKFEKIIL